MSTYDRMVAALKALTVPIAEYEWATRPTGDFGTVRIDFEATPLIGDCEKLERVYEGSVDLFLRGPYDATKAGSIEAILQQYCESSWRENSRQYENSTGLLHIEWVFQVVNVNEPVNDDNGN